MNKSRSRKLLEIFGIIVYFLGLLSFFLFLYQSEYTCFHDSYGLLKGSKEHIVIQNFWDVLDFIFITSVNGLYMFLGEKAAVVLGYQIAVRMIGCLLLFAGLSLLSKKLIAFILTSVYAIIPLLFFEQYIYDGMLILEFIIFVCIFLCGILVTIIKRKNKKNNQNHIKKSVPEDKNMLAVDKEEKIENDYKEESHTQFIKNPLPVPKRHVRKEMTYDIEVSADKMDYDILIPAKNYYDIE